MAKGSLPTRLSFAPEESHKESMDTATVACSVMSVIFFPFDTVSRLYPCLKPFFSEGDFSCDAERIFLSLFRKRQGWWHVKDSQKPLWVGNFFEGFVLFWSLPAVGTEDVTTDGMNPCPLLLGPMVTLLHSSVVLSPSFWWSKVVTRRPWFRCIELKKKSCHNQSLYQRHLVHHVCCRPFFLSFFIRLNFILLG